MFCFFTIRIPSRKNRTGNGVIAIKATLKQIHPCEICIRSWSTFKPNEKHLAINEIGTTSNV
ncbi:hypothetical protein DPMN_052930 [Dreissena polymorpha]|uniref:Uncharacterized protein n=1 Tax=Dreissena polymorpha TaxID=45954 RepID=A0A9D4CLP4_DREPO|nr:hypothetical protein DPMN_052930 [Dreissena polymorpha]